MLAERVTDAVAIPSSNACDRLLCITDSSHACQSSKLLGMAVEATQFTRCYLQRQPFQKRERGSEGGMLKLAIGLEVILKCYLVKVLPLHCNNICKFTPMLVNVHVYSRELPGCTTCKFNNAGA